MIRLAIAALVSAAVAYWAGREHEYRITQRQGLDAGDDIDQPVHIRVDPRVAGFGSVADWTLPPSWPN